mgnify:CR=1 FL=1
MFVALPVIYVAVVQLFSVVQGAWLSLTNTSLLSPTTNEFVGLRNFGDIVGASNFPQVLIATLVCTAGTMGGARALGLRRAW